jgi:O-antigen/teichoic acid export membrane protein
MPMARIDSGDGAETLTRNGAWLLGTRIVAMCVGLLGLPIMMSTLGVLQFGSWAVLLGGTFAFGTLELGMSSAVMRWTTLALMPESTTAESHKINAIMSNSLACAAAVFALVGVAIYFAADPLAAWLNLPATQWFSAGQCILIIYATVAMMALLRCTIAPLLAARKMASHASFTVLQSIVGAAATWGVAGSTHRLDLVLLANSLTIVAVQTFAAVWTRRRMPWRFEYRLLEPKLARAMLGYGAALQFSDLATFVMYQFDKLMISGMVSPTEVTHYEVASRTAQALGSVSSAPFVAFTPSLTERHGRNEDASTDLLRMLRLTVLGVGFFLLLPLAVSPIGLFAWVGQIGYHAAGTFALLVLSVISTMLIMPLSITAQAKGRASIEFTRAACAMVINVPASVLLIHSYGKEGAALGTLIACAVANSLFAWWMLRALALSWKRIVVELGQLLRAIVATASLIALATHLIEPLVISTRWLMAPAAAALYSIGVLVLSAWLWRGGAFHEEERAVILSLRRRWTI